MTRFLSKSAALASACILALAAGCATTRMESEWRNPQYAGPSLKGHKVLIVCRAPDETFRRVCEDQWAMQLSPRGATGVPSYAVPGAPAGDAVTAEQIAAALRATESVAMLQTQVAFRVTPVVRPAPFLGIGIGGGSGGGWFGGGVTVPITGQASPPQQSIAAKTSLTGSGDAVLWSGTATAPVSDNAAAQISDLVAMTADAIQKSGLL
jgi:hypothetical protein